MSQTVLRALRALGLSTILLASIGYARAGEQASISELAVQREAEVARVALRIQNGLSSTALERIDSGIPVAFRYRIDLQDRRSWWLPTKVLARTTVEARVTYDTLTGRYSLTREVVYLGRERKRRPSVEQRQETDSVDDVRSWLTELTDVELFLPPRLPRAERLRVRVETTIGRRYVMWIFPASLTISAETPFDN